MFNLFKLIASIFFSLGLLACADFFAGGVDEERNTVAGVAEDDLPSSIPNPDPLPASDSIVEIINEPSKNTDDNVEFKGILLDDEGNILNGAAVIVADKFSSVIGATTTNTDGAFVVEVDKNCSLDSVVFYGNIGNTGFAVVDYYSIDTTIINVIRMKKSRSFYGKIEVDTKTILYLNLTQPESYSQTGTTDSLGNFVFENLPEGDYTLQVSSINTKLYSEAVYLLRNDSSAQKMYGPIPASAVSYVSIDDLKERPVQEYADNPSPTPADSNPLVCGEGVSCGTDVISIASNRLPYSLDYGVLYSWVAPENGLVVEDDFNITDYMENITVEVVLQFDSLVKDSSYRKNIFGKFNGSDTVFSLAVINDMCNTNTPSLAFFIDAGHNDFCSDAIVSVARIETGKKIYITAMQDDEYMSLYMNGVRVALKPVYPTPFKQALAPFVFGDDGLNMELDKVRLGDAAIYSADVLYRYYQAGGEP